MLYNTSLILSFIYIVFSIIWAVFNGTYRWYILIISIVPILIIVTRLIQARKFIDVKLTSGITDPGNWTVFEKEYPVYKYVDIYKSIETYLKNKIFTTIRSFHNESLSSIMSVEFISDEQRKVNISPQRSFNVSLKKDEYFPEDIFWKIYEDSSKKDVKSLIRFKYNNYTHKGQLFVSAADSNSCNSCINEIENFAKKKSIYLKQLVEIEFQEEVKDEFGDIAPYEKVDLVFIKNEHIDDKKIVLDPKVKELLNNSIIDFNAQRKQLERHNIPLKRGIIFYGPPGTGKTYTSKYLSNKLKDCTTIIVKGSSLLKIKAVCNIARSLQPSLVILEDIDLLFSNREMNPYNYILGEFLDQLDGFSDTDRVIFIMTTNSIERVETAIKDRPGRVSQCIYMGPPSNELRHQYIYSLLKQYAVKCPNIDIIVKKTEGTSQAFLKEIVIRAIQIAIKNEKTKLAIINQEHLLNAFDIVTNSIDERSKRILGFID